MNRKRNQGDTQINFNLCTFGFRPICGTLMLEIGTRIPILSSVYRLLRKNFPQNSSASKVPYLGRFEALRESGVNEID